MKDAGTEKTIDSLIISLNCESSESDSTNSEDNGSDDSEDQCYGIKMLDLKKFIILTTLLSDFLVQQTYVMFVWKNYRLLLNEDVTLKLLNEIGNIPDDE